MESEILAAGTIVKEPGMLRRRLVLRVFRDNEGSPVEFVVHVQCFLNRAVSYCYGSYFPCRQPSAAEKMAAYEEALKCFAKRMLEKDLGLFYESVFGKQANEARRAVNKEPLPS